MNIRGPVPTFVFLAVTAGAAELRIPLEYFKVAATVLGAIWGLGKFLYAAKHWGEKQVREAVSSEITRHFKGLPCVRSGGAICDDEGRLIYPSNSRREG